ncbi:MAG: polynucleotide adenylyltransferase PcnB [Leptonema sp. (in: bacteria)]
MSGFWERMKLFFRKRSVNDFLKYPEGKRIYREFHPLRNNMMDPMGLKVLQKLLKNKYKAYFVGGCIRDLLINRNPKDFDIVTNATPKEIKKLFKNSRIIGKRFKIVHVYYKSLNKNEIKIIEVSTFRKIPEHRLNGNPKKIDHNLLKRDNIYGNPKEDAARRDFTINSLFYDPTKEVIVDYTGGFEDIKNKTIRAIGDPDISFKEDPVRMLRAAKFAPLLDFKIEKKSLKYIKKNKEEILKVNKNRLHEEFMKIFKTGMSAKIFESIYYCGLFDVLFPNVINQSIAQIGKNEKPKKIKFSDTPIAKRLQIADRMLTEREDLTFNIYMCLILADSISEVFLERKKNKEPIDQYIRKKLDLIFKHLQISGKDQERIFQIFVFQRQIGFLNTNTKKLNKNKLNNLKAKSYFFEAFMVYKIYSLALENEEMIQKAMVWEIGPRTKPPSDAKIISLYNKTPKFPLLELNQESEEN